MDSFYRLNLWSLSRRSQQFAVLLFASSLHKSVSELR